VAGSLQLLIVRFGSMPTGSGSLSLGGFGDETSFALAAALRNSPHSEGAIHLFEASDVAASRQVLETIGIGQATLIQRIADDAHLGAVEKRRGS
jgi:hypothetical protein